MFEIAKRLYGHPVYLVHARVVVSLFAILKNARISFHHVPKTTRSTCFTVFVLYDCNIIPRLCKFAPRQTLMEITSSSISTSHCTQQTLPMRLEWTAEPPLYYQWQSNKVGYNNTRRSLTSLNVICFRAVFWVVAGFPCDFRSKS